MKQDTNTEVVISCLLHAIEDAQGTIRAYDSKAEILGVLLTIALGITNFTFLQQPPGALSNYLLGASWLLGLLALGLLGMVLLPKKDQFRGLSYGTYEPTGAYFLINVRSCPQNTVSALASKAKQTDWASELTYESMKLSLIRDSKHRCFIWALKAAGLTLLLISVAVVVEGAGWAI